MNTFNVTLEVVMRKNTTTEFGARFKNLVEAYQNKGFTMDFENITKEDCQDLAFETRNKTEIKKVVTTFAKQNYAQFKNLVKEGFKIKAIKVRITKDNVEQFNTTLVYKTR